MTKSELYLSMIKFILIYKAEQLKTRTKDRTVNLHNMSVSGSRYNTFLSSGGTSTGADLAMFVAGFVFGWLCVCL